MKRIKVHIAYAPDDTLYGYIPETGTTFNKVRSLDELLRDLLHSIKSGEG